MSFLVSELPKATADKRAIAEWLLERSPQGASAWLNAYDTAIVGLESNALAFGVAFEDKDCPDRKVQQTFFKTRRGRVYRLLYTVQEKHVYVLRVRGPGQASVEADEIR